MARDIGMSGGAVTGSVAALLHRAGVARYMHYYPDMNEHGMLFTRIVVLVEDEEPLRRAVTFTLKRLGCKVVGCISVEQAIGVMQKMREQQLPVALIIADLQPAGSNGMELVRFAVQQCKKVPVLVMSGYTARAVREELLRYTGVTLLEKPFDTAELAARVMVLTNPGMSN
jgi:two-component system response regulator FlrC